MKITDVTSGITQERLKHLFSYNHVSGVFTRKVTVCNAAKAGEVAGYSDSLGYLNIKIDGKPYKASRLAFLYMTGRWPIAVMDHINGDTTDSQWKNLREATILQNVYNSSGWRNATVLVKGVFLSRRKQNPYRAAIRINGVLRHLGNYPTVKLAANAYATAAKQLHGDFTREAA